MSKVVFLFPGQGAQVVGMGRHLHGTLDRARGLYERAAEILGYDLSRLCFEGPEEALDSTVVSQPALFVTSLAALESMRLESPAIVEACSAVAGLSLGEYTAMVFAGAMEFEDALRVVQRRGEAMQAAADTVQGGMVSILGLELDAVERLCAEARERGEVLQVANRLCPGNIVISGHKRACEKAADLADSFGAMKAMPLAVAGAFHTELMRPAVDELAEALADVPMRSPRIPVVSNVDAQVHDDPRELRELLVQQVVSQVRWEESMRYVLDQGARRFYEIGPGRVLRGLLKRIDRKVSCDNVSA
ncbi:MAG: ACP S-malonyltransferase [Planctomycetota bacterium]